MTTARRTLLPPAARDWLVPNSHSSVLTLGAPSASFARALDAEQHRLTLTDRHTQSLRSLLAVVPRARRIVAQAESLPFTPMQFDVVLACQTFHQLAPGLALAEIARVLKADGQLSIMYLTRDDSVPWVRRLSALIRAVDETSMRGGYGEESVAALDDCKYFPHVEHRSFRMWVPVSGTAMIEMVRSRLSLQRLDGGRLDELVAAVGQLYDDSARAPEPLMLPWNVACWRAKVDHSELTSALASHDTALNIRL